MFYDNDRRILVQLSLIIEKVKIFFHPEIKTFVRMFCINLRLNSSCSTENGFSYLGQDLDSKFTSEYFIKIGYSSVLDFPLCPHYLTLRRTYDC